MSNLVEHAKKELNSELLSYDEYNDAIVRDVLELITTFAKQQHTSTSAAFVRHLFNELAQFNVVSPLTGKQDEWDEVSPNFFQNNRNSAVFKNTKNHETYCINAIVWEDPNGGIYTNKDSALNIEHFPFTPKSFIVRVDKDEKIIDQAEYEKAKRYYRFTP